MEKKFSHACLLNKNAYYADMKANQLMLLLLFLMLGAAAAQQTNSSPSATTNETISELKAKAETGDAIAQHNLGVCYYYGDGVTKDVIEAVKWYCYFKGEGVSKDYVEACKWYNVASVHGDEGAKKSLAIVEQGMTTEQITKAQQLAREFKPDIELSSDASVSGKDIPISSPPRNTKR